MVDGTGMCGACRVAVGGQYALRLRRRAGVRRASGGLRRDDDAHEGLQLITIDFLIAMEYKETQAYKMAPRDDAWREELRQAMSARDRSAIARVVMPALDPAVRVTCNEEVNRGLDRSTGHPQGNPLPRLRRPAVYHRLPCEHQHPRLHQKHTARRLRPRHRRHQGHKRPPRRLRPRMPSGKTVREPLHI